MDFSSTETNSWLTFTNSVLTVIVAIAIPIIVWIFKKYIIKDIMLSYSINSSPLLNSQEDEIKLFINNTPIENNTSVVSIIIRNTGNKPITPEIQRDLIQFHAAKGTKFISAKIVETTPSDLPIAAIVKNNVINLLELKTGKPFLINPEMEITIVSLVNNPYKITSIDDITPFVYIDGLSKMKPFKDFQKGVKFTVNVLAPIVGVILFALTPLFINNPSLSIIGLLLLAYPTLFNFGVYIAQRFLSKY